VCAAACIVPVDIDIKGVNDSKTLKTEEEREALFEVLVSWKSVV
jgi:ribonuclease HII